MNWNLIWFSTSRNPEKNNNFISTVCLIFNISRKSIFLLQIPLSYISSTLIWNARLLRRVAFSRCIQKSKQIALSMSQSVTNWRNINVGLFSGSDNGTYLWSQILIYVECDGQDYSLYQKCCVMPIPLLIFLILIPCQLFYTRYLGEIPLVSSTGAAGNYKNNLNHRTISFREKIFLL